MDNTNETEEKKASGFQDSSTSHQKSSEMSSKSYSSPTDNADEEEELEIDEVSFSGVPYLCKKSHEFGSFISFGFLTVM